MIYRPLIFPAILYFIAKVHGQCHECQSNFVACHDEKRFTMCTEGTSNDYVFSCPIGYVCTDATEICLKSSDSNPVQSTCEPSCDQCNSPDKLFACLSDDIYAYCFGADEPNYTATGTCPYGYVCNLKSRKVCTSHEYDYPSCYNGSSISRTTTIMSTSTTPLYPSGSTDDDKSTTDAMQSTFGTTEEPQDKDSFCRDKNQAGLYPSKNDLTCREYILCYELSGQYLGTTYTCSTSKYFNRNTQKCESVKPDYCMDA